MINKEELLALLADPEFRDELAARVARQQIERSGGVGLRLVPKEEEQHDEREPEEPR